MAAYARRMFAGGAIQTTVPLSIGSSDSSFTLATGGSTNWPDGSTGNFVVVVDVGTPEKILCSSRTGLVVTVAASGRGYDGTSAVSHPAGSAIQVVHCAQDDDEANQVVSAVLGQSGAAKGDILTMLSAAGPNTLTRVGIGSSTQVLGVSSGLPAWETPTNGYGITGFAANPMTPAVSLTTASGNIPTNVTLAAGPATTKIFDTASLGIGTWLVNITISFDSPSGAVGTVEFTVATDTATATFAGVISTGNSNLVAAQEGGEQSASLSFIATVTGAGTLKLSAYNSSSTAQATAYATTPVQSFANATGYVAIRIA